MGVFQDKYDELDKRLTSLKSQHKNTTVALLIDENVIPYLKHLRDAHNAELAQSQTKKYAHEVLKMQSGPQLALSDGTDRFNEVLNDSVVPVMTKIADQFAVDVQTMKTVRDHLEHLKSIYHLALAAETEKGTKALEDLKAVHAATLKQLNQAHEAALAAESNKTTNEKSDLSALNAVHKKLQDTHTQLQSALAERETQLEEINKQRASAAADVGVDKSRIRELESEKKELEKRVAELQADTNASALSEEISHLKAALYKKDADDGQHVKLLKDEIDALNVRVKDKEEKLISLRKTESLSKQSIHSLQQQISIQEEKLKACDQFNEKQEPLLLELEELRVFKTKTIVEEQERKIKEKEREDKLKKQSQDICGAKITQCQQNNQKITELEKENAQLKSKLETAKGQLQTAKTASKPMSLHLGPKKTTDDSEELLLDFQKNLKAEVTSYVQQTVKTQHEMWDLMQQLQNATTDNIIDRVVAIMNKINMQKRKIMLNGVETEVAIDGLANLHEQNINLLMMKGEEIDAKRKEITGLKVELQSQAAELSRLKKEQAEASHATKEPQKEASHATKEPQKEATEETEVGTGKSFEQKFKNCKAKLRKAQEQLDVAQAALKQKEDELPIQEPQKGPSKKLGPVSNETTLRKELKETRDTINSLQQQVENLNASLASRTAELDVLNKMIEAVQAQVVKMKNQYHTQSDGLWEVIDEINPGLAAKRRRLNPKEPETKGLEF